MNTGTRRPSDGAVPGATVAAVDAAVVRITQGPDAVGTGFFVLPGWVLTCAHVHDPADPRPLRVHWRDRELPVRATVAPAPGEPPDLLLVNVDHDDHPVLPLGPSGYGVFGFYAYGHQWEDRGYRGYPASGRVTGSTTYHGRPGRPEPPQRLLVLNDAAVRPGISGGPVHSLVDDRVVGVVKRSNPDGGGYAVPVEEAEALRPGLLEENAAAVDRAGGGPGGGRRSAAVSGYLMSLQREHSYVTFANLERDVRLDEVYVTLTLAADTLDGAAFSRRPGGGFEFAPEGANEKRDSRRDRGSPQPRTRQPNAPLGELLAAPCATVLGEPGAGKTTLLRHLLVRTCRGELFGGDLPVFVRIASLTEEPDCLRAYLRGAYPAVADELLTACATGRAVFFLDGLDEAPAPLQRRVAEEIRRLLAAQNRFYVSCRTVAFPRGLLPGAFRTFECVGFSRGQRARFLARWFEDRPAVAHDIERQIDVNPALTKFGQNPLMLSLLSAAQRDNDEVYVPRQRTELYAVLLDVLLTGRESADGDCSPLLKRSFLSWLALELMHLRRESFGEEEFYALWGRFVAERPAGAAPATTPYQLLSTLTERDAILLRGPGGRYGFLHLTFQEYFAARALGGRPDGPDQALGRCHDPRWEEVVRLYTGMLGPDDAERFVTRIAFAPGGAPRSVEALTLAARCASDGLDEAAPVCDDLVDALLPVAFGPGSPLAVEAAHALAALAAAFPEYVGTVADRLFGAHRPPRHLFVRYVDFLGLVAGEVAGEVLAEMLRRLAETDPTTSDRPVDAAFDLEGWVLCAVEVVEALGRCGRPESVPLLAPLLDHPMSAVSGAVGQALDEIPLSPESGPLLAGPDGTLLGRLRAPLAMRVTSPAFVRETMRALFVDAPDPVGQLAIRHAVDPEWVEGDRGFHARLLHDATDDHARANLLSLTSLGVYAEDTGSVLETALDGGAQERLRVAALAFLLRCRPALTRPLVTGLLDEGDPTLVRAAFSALGRTGNTQAHALLLKRSLRRDHDWLIDLCLRLFCQVPAPVCRGWLRTVRTSHCGPDDGERLRLALLCSSALRDPSVLPSLAALLRTPGPAGLVDRVTAYRGLARLEHPRAEGLLLRALSEEDDPTATVQGIEALGALRTPGAEEALLSYLDPATWPPNWPARSPDPGQGEQRPSDQRVLAAAVALARTGTPRAIGPLEGLSGRRTENAGLRRVAYEAVRTIRYSAQEE
ncbi:MULTISPECIES: serine protease [Streptomyces]|uniref:NACHT domain-containing protein n=1 Tax=Streptomyces doudnae TaxID=3075536 RepID=A0ABD5EPR4_9ACTN|nr:MULTISPECIES: serine protease [unclassified Streptomyces]MDT0436293.1 NACHT domain-containing protein [Streptomyces sp. DSM 41981]MYQ65248.1 NACHT domain-containing protein [Streptomyces sp. SID4950]SCD95744.1 Trypsin-like peptidase domain-containing protein [Streptomyces sp. SolWspMP-5a-2]